MTNSKKIVLTYGTFDLFHYGHYNILKRAADLGDSLIVGVSSDEMCFKKGKIPFLSQDKRMEIISSLKFVDNVILEKDMHQKVSDVIKYDVNIFLLGDDYKDIFPKMSEYTELLNLNCEIVFLPRTPDVSTTEMKKKIAIQQYLDENSESLHNATKNN